jgi:hypothetical protein
VRGAHAPPGGTSVDVGRGRPLVVDDKGVGHEEKFSRNPRVNRTGCVVCACVYCGVRRIVFARNRILVHFVHAVVFFSLVCLSDALRLNLRTEKQFVDASREKVAKIFPTFFYSIYFSTVFHVGEEIGEFVLVVDCRETFLWRTIADEERKDRLSFVLLIRRKEENKNTKESGEEDGRVLYV